MYRAVLGHYFDEFILHFYWEEGISRIPYYTLDAKLTEYVQSLFAGSEGKKSFWIDSFKGYHTNQKHTIYWGRRVIGGKQVATYGAMAFDYMLEEYSPFPLRKNTPYLLVAYKNSESRGDHVYELPGAACAGLRVIGNKVIYLDDAGLLVKKPSLIPVVQPDVCTFEEALSVLL